MVKVLSGAVFLVVVAGVLWVINPFGGDDEGFVWSPEPEVSDTELRRRDPLRLA